MSRTMKLIEDYVKNVESYLVGYVKTEKDRFLEELSDFLQQEYQDFCLNNDYSVEDPSAVETFLHTIDSPKETAMDFRKNFEGPSSILNTLLTSWVQFEEFIFVHPILAALLIGCFFAVPFPVIFFIAIGWILSATEFIILTGIGLLLSRYFPLVDYVFYSLSQSAYPLIMGCSALGSFFSIMAITWGSLRDYKNTRSSSIFLVTTLLVYGFLLLVIGIINPGQNVLLIVPMSEVSTELYPALLVLNIVMYLFIIIIAGIVLASILTKVNQMKTPSFIKEKRTIVILGLILLLAMSGVLGGFLWQTLTPKLSYTIVQAPLNEMQDNNHFEVIEETYGRPTLSFFQFLKTYAGAKDSLHIEMQLQGNNIIITETYDAQEVDTQQLRPYDISGHIEPLQDGTYTIHVVFNDNVQNTTEVLFETTVDFVCYPD